MEKEGYAYQEGEVVTLYSRLTPTILFIVLLGLLTLGITIF